MLTTRQRRFRDRRSTRTMGVPRAWTPARLPALKLWLSADFGVYEDGGVTPATNGRAVARWLDRSGNGWHFSQSVAGSRPTFRFSAWVGLPEVAFVNHKLFHSPADLAAGDMTVVAAGSFASGLNKPVLDVYTPRLTFMAGTNVAGKAGLYDGAYRYATNQVAGKQRLAWCLDAAAAKARFYRDGAACGVSTYTPRVAGGMMTLMNTVSGMPHAGSLYELVLCAASLSDEERAELNQYLQRWFG